MPQTSLCLQLSHRILLLQQKSMVEFRSNTSLTTISERKQKNSINKQTKSYNHILLFNHSVTFQHHENNYWYPSNFIPYLFSELALPPYSFIIMLTISSNMAKFISSKTLYSFNKILIR